MADRRQAPTIRAAKLQNAPSVFEPANLLREARRQRGLPDENVPAVCALDPDGDIVRNLRAGGHAHKAPGWACYHTDTYVTEHAGLSVGIGGCAVGAPFAVRALRDEGTSHHYLPPSIFAESDPALADRAFAALGRIEMHFGDIKTGDVNHSQDQHRWRDSGLGSELENSSCNAKGKPYKWETRRGKVPMCVKGADHPVVAMKRL